MGKEWPTGKGWRMFEDEDGKAYAGWEMMEGGGWRIACRVTADGGRYLQGCERRDVALAAGTAQNWADHLGEFADEPKPQPEAGPKWPTPVVPGTVKDGGWLLLCGGNYACAACGSATGGPPAWYWGWVGSESENGNLCVACFELLREDKAPDPQPERIVLAEGMIETDAIYGWGWKVGSRHFLRHHPELTSHEGEIVRLELVIPRKAPVLRP